MCSCRLGGTLGYYFSQGVRGTGDLGGLGCLGCSSLFDGCFVELLGGLVLQSFSSGSLFGSDLSARVRCNLWLFEGDFPTGVFTVLWLSGSVLLTGVLGSSRLGKGCMGGVFGGSCLLDGVFVGFGFLVAFFFGVVGS